jgi:hypothetical protein
MSSSNSVDVMKKQLESFRKKIMDKGEQAFKEEFDKNMKLAELCRQEGYYPGMWDFIGRAKALMTLLDSIKD